MCHVADEACRLRADVRRLKQARCEAFYESPLPAAQMPCWSDIPEHLTAVILRMAFRDSGRALTQWLRMGLVCRHASIRLFTFVAALSHNPAGSLT